MMMMIKNILSQLMIRIINNVCVATTLRNCKMSYSWGVVFSTELHAYGNVMIVQPLTKTKAALLKSIQA